jgi:hypothetical protein
MIDAAKTIKRHWNGILRWHDTYIANGILEGINCLSRPAKARARRLPDFAQPEGDELPSRNPDVPIRRGTTLRHMLSE